MASACFMSRILVDIKCEPGCSLSRSISTCKKNILDEVYSIALMQSSTDCLLKKQRI